MGGFSFYERTEIKDMVSYLKVIVNPDDSVSLLRVINTPVRGIGKTTVETLEALALETGLSLWGAMGEAIQRQLLPLRACLALRNFRELIEDAQAMLAGTYEERLTQESSAGVPPATQRLARPEGAQRLEGSRPLSEPERELAEHDSTQFDPLAFDFGDSADDKSFVFGESPELEASGDGRQDAGATDDGRQDAGPTDDDGAFRGVNGRRCGERTEEDECRDEPMTTA